MQVLVISCSMNPHSRSAALAERAWQMFHARGTQADWLDLRQTELPLCDGHAAYADARVAAVRQRIERAGAILLAMPIYNYDVNAAAKNLVELTGRAWSDKAVGMLCAAGGPGSYMAPMSLANSLMLDFHCVILPRFVFTSSQPVDENGAFEPEIAERLEALCDHLQRLAGALGGQVHDPGAS